MIQKLILNEIQLLPEFEQMEVFNYVLFVKSKYLNKMNKQKETPKHPTFGCGSVKITMTEDFDDLLEDFKEYM